MAFVKFLRGSSTAYQNLNVKNNDTLYFIYDNNDEEHGKLYLGSKLIGGTNAEVIENLSSLKDVKIASGSLIDGALLQYDASLEQKWKPVSIKTAIERSGAVLGSAVAIGETTNEKDFDDIVEEIAPNAVEGLLIVVDNVPYIYDGENWQSLNSGLGDRVSALETAVGQPANPSQDITASGLYAQVGSLSSAIQNLNNDLQSVQSLIINSNHLKYEIINDVSDADLTKDNIVYLVANGTDSGNNIYDEYLVINGALEKICILQADLSNYVQTNDSRLLTAEQIQKLNNLVIDEDGQIVVSGTINAANVQGLSDVISQQIANEQYIKSVQSGVFSVTASGKLELTSVPNSVLSFNPDNFVLQSVVGNLSDLNDPVSENTNLVMEINDLKDKLSWHEINQGGE